MELRNCVLPEKLAEFDRISKYIFESCDSEESQAGLHKLEACVQIGLFKCLKTYCLFPFESESGDPEARATKCRGLTRGIRREMKTDCFLVPVPAAAAEGGERPEKVYFNNVSMAPSLSGQVFISVKRRCMTNALNTKRRLSEVEL